MTTPNSPHSDEIPIIRRGRVEALNIYEVKEHELELLEKERLVHYNLTLPYSFFQQHLPVS